MHSGRGPHAKCFARILFALFSRSPLVVVWLLDRLINVRLLQALRFGNGAMLGSELIAWWTMC